MGRPSYQQVLAENHKLREEVAALQRENAALQKRVAELQNALETAQRKAKRQAAPFSKGPPKEKPRKPGRKPGRRYGRKAHRNPPPPEQIDEHHEVPLPECCAHCGSDDLQETHVASQYQIDIPRRPVYRQFDLHFGVCQNCGRTVHGRHELQTSDAFGRGQPQGLGRQPKLERCSGPVGVNLDPPNVRPTWSRCLRIPHPRRQLAIICTPTHCATLNKYIGG